MDKKSKKLFKEFFKQKQYQPMPSLLERERCYGDWDRWVEYGFLGEDMTDEEIKECIDEMRVPICYEAWDCTGYAFTEWIDVHTNPTGLVSFIHHMARDV